MPSDESIETKLAVLANDMNYIRRTLDQVDNKISTHYVSKEEFEPIKRIVYGLVGLILVAVVGALLSLVVVKQ
jgi:hypothetical protein